MATVQNIHGRKWGRGLRPWLLLPKYLCVSLILGGIAAIAVLGIAGRSDRRAGELAWAILQYQVFPALAGATLLGILLLIHHGSVMLKMRWLWAKLGAIVLAGLIVHLLLKTQILAQQQSPPTLMTPMAGIALGAFMVVAIIGRLKPRLGQRYQTAQNR